MSRAVITEGLLTDIADAIRAKNGGSDTYTPGQMAAAIEAIPTGTTPTGTVNITENGTVDVTSYANANVSVPNSYAAGDEGKVVSNGALVAQTARASQITANGTYDTTNNNSVTVNVSGGGAQPVQIMSQGQVSTTSNYATAYFDAGVDPSAYDIFSVDLWKNGVKIGRACTFMGAFIISGSDNLSYSMEISASYIKCTNYRGSYFDLYVDVYGIDLS